MSTKNPTIARRQLPFPSPRHEQVHDLLRRLVSQGAGDAFADACAILTEQPPLRTAAHLVGHLIRELEGELISVLMTFPGAREVQIPKENRHVFKINAILGALDLTNQPVAAWWTSLAGKDRGWVGLAHRDNFRAPRPVDDVLTRMDVFVDVLAIVLDAAEANYSSAIAALDGVLTNPSPSDAEVTFLTPYLATGVTALTHVFEKLPAAWLAPLRRDRVFSQPPDVRLHDDGGISFPGWPQASYLRRIASELPADVADTIASVPVVDNEIVHLEFLRAAQAMPTPLAARVAKHEMHWLASRLRWMNDLVSMAVKDLCRYLIEGGAVDTGVELIRVALSPAPDVRVAGRRAEPRASTWYYSELVRETLQPLWRCNAEIAKSLMFELLDLWAPGGLSIWPGPIEEAGQHGVGEPFDSLLSTLRDLFETETAVTEGALRRGISDLEARNGRLWKRLALYLLRKNGKDALDLVVERACSQQLLDSDEEFHDVARMIQDEFPRLDPTGRETIVAALRENSSEEHVGRLVGADDTEQHQIQVRLDARLRRRQLFALLGEARSPEVAAEYQELCNVLGEPDQLISPAWTHSLRRGPNSPRIASELLALSDSELIAYLRDWSPPSSNPFEPSRSGLTQELKACASLEPQRFSRLARDFRVLHPVYAAGLFWGLREASQRALSRTESAEGVGDTLAIDWDSILDLAQSIVHSQGHLSDVERDGTWARRMAVDVLRDAALVAGADNGDRRTRAWGLMAILLRDPDPSASRIDKKSADDETFVINTIRGLGLHAAIDMAASLASAASDDRDAALRGEILSAIEARIDKAIEPSLAIRAVVARRFNTLFVADARRASDIATAIFPNRENGAEESWSLWQAFLSRNSPSRPVYEALANHYAVAVETIGRASSQGAADLGEHLAWLAVWGVIGPGTGDQLLRRYVQSAPSAARHKALEDVGRALHRTKGPLEGDAIARLRELWEWWAETVGATRDAVDVAAFGWWFSSSVFDAGWSLAKLDQALVYTAGTLDWDHSVAERLADWAGAFPKAVAGCLEKFVAVNLRNRLERCGGSIRTALTTLAAGPEGVGAKVMASRLVARGYPEYGALAVPRGGVKVSSPAPGLPPTG